MNVLAQAATALAAVRSADQAASPGKVLCEFFELEQSDQVAAKLRLIKLLDDGIELISRVTDDEEHRREIIAWLVATQGTILHASSLPKAGEFASKAAQPNTIQLLRGYALAIDTSKIRPHVPFDRASFIASTDQLIQTIQDSSVDVFEKQSLLLSLVAVRRIASEGQAFTDNQVRRRIKAVFADFTSDFRRLDKEHEEIHETVLRWARAAVGPGAFALALVADGSAVAGLLMPPEQ